MSQILRQTMFSRLLCAVCALILSLLPLASPAQQALIGLRQDGPNAQVLGQAAAYPGCRAALTKPECRVGEWSRPATGQSNSQRVEPSATPLPLPVHPSPTELKWKWERASKGLDDYLDMTQVTGLMVLKEGMVVAERYQYDRQPGMPMRSFSMAKTFTAMLVGIALHKGYIRSLDDLAADYWPEIAPSAYGQTTLRNLLRMSSGVAFRELYTWTPDDDIWVWSRVLYETGNQGQTYRVAEYLNARTQREVPQGSRFHYASIETEILGRVLVRATGKSVSELTQAWIWQPMGAEHTAHWLVSTTDGVAATAGGFNASLRDYARFGWLLANDGRLNGEQIIPKEFLLDATDPQRQPAAFKPKVATAYLGYGYQVWLLPYKTRTFALQGIHGQTVYVQPSSGIVMVQTAVFDKASGRQDARPYQLRHALWEGVLDSLGGVRD